MRSNPQAAIVSSLNGVFLKGLFGAIIAGEDAGKVSAAVDSDSVALLANVNLTQLVILKERRMSVNNSLDLIGPLL